MELNNITKKYGDNLILDNISYNFGDNEITVILGESGVGKTTLLNIILGVTEFDGEIKNKGKMSCVYQNDRLIPNLSVKDNLLLINKNINVDSELNKFDLLESKNMLPSSLSAGMSRRVAILRAMNYPCDILLMDEPLRNLDYAMKYKIMDEIKSYHKGNKNAIIIVTHDIDEAVYLANKIIILKDKKIAKEISKISENTKEEILQFLLNK